MSGEQSDILTLLDDQIEGGADGFIHDEEIKEAPPSPTALELDDWSLRRGQEVLLESDRLKGMFEVDKRPENVRDAALATADFAAAAFEPEHKFAAKPKNERIARYMRKLIETPEFQALHAETQLDEMASEIAAAKFAEGWVAIVAQEEPEGEFEKDMQALRAAAKSLGDAAREVSDLGDMRSAMGLGGGGGDSGTKIKSGEMVDIFKRVRSSPELRRICELAGRYRRMAQAKQRKRVLHGQDDVVGVTLDGDVSRLLPAELVALADPDLELDAIRRIVERTAQCRDFRGVEGQARGPIVVVVDESGSMGGEPVANAKALALSLYWIAKHQKRYCALVGFSGGTDGNYLVLPPGEEKPAELLEWLEHFYGCGTDMDVPLVELPARWEAMGCPKGKTDIVVITDAYLHVPDEVRDSFNQFKAREKVKLVSLVLGPSGGELECVSDRLHCLTSISVESDAIGDTLSL